MAWKQAARSTDLLSRDARRNRTRNTGAATSKTEWGPHLLGACSVLEVTGLGVPLASRQHSRAAPNSVAQSIRV
jgi:hypothetical protein